jgi:uncharacterized membrane protein
MLIKENSKVMIHSFFLFLAIGILYTLNLILNKKKFDTEFEPIFIGMTILKILMLLVATALKQSENVRKRYQLVSMIISFLFQLFYYLMMCKEFGKKSLNENENLMQYFCSGIFYTFVYMIFIQTLRTWKRKLLIMTTGILFNVYFLSTFYEN